jgi:hypothetical protein
MSQEFRQGISEYYDTAADLPSLARLIYVRVLFKVYAQAHGKNSSAKDIAYRMTAALLHDAVGFTFSIAEVQELVEESADEAASNIQTPPPDEKRPGSRR